jgi:hypothetical protein
VVWLWFQSRVFLWKQGGFMASSRGQPEAQAPPPTPNPQAPSLPVPWLSPLGESKASRPWPQAASGAPILKHPGETGRNDKKGAALHPPRQRPAAQRGASRVWPPALATLAGRYFIVPGCCKMAPSRQCEFLALTGRKCCIGGGLGPQGGCWGPVLSFSSCRLGHFW